MTFTEVQTYRRKGSVRRKTPIRRVLKRKVGKRTKRPKNPLKKARKELWELCKQIIRKKYGNTCYTCDAKNLAGSNWHTAHFIARSICGLYLRYDLRNLRPGCYRCNISLAGNGAAFYRRLVDIEGQTYVDGIFADKNRAQKETLAFYQDLILHYQQLLKDLDEKVVA